ncbi:MAG TPA: C-GCAxxG-C-C family protein [Bacillota bacterium]|nr:C-GCAxxG-C-C family protein [Bacillota bacterium]HNT03606.1 C-GCAxxG-C-C family protein [Bacillota bacterium]HPA55431.1 C-GCAxxG-C-C family protein [Bacillota bacterium]HPX67972.1 C-GCAxxG-C-C family protein [Bacillota bacterium]HQA64903.1 C-GCAxxG-C-C family protein [Bacillota bacterium]
MENIMTLEKVNELRSQGFNCSQIVFLYGSERLGLEPEKALKIAGAFGGGMYNGETCGCVTGALMVLGLKYGQSVPYDLAAKNLLIQKKTEFEEKFKEAHETLICKEILGYDISNPSEKSIIVEKGLLDEICPYLIWDACQILDEML